jgi:hypothetical protein
MVNQNIINDATPGNKQVVRRVVVASIPYTKRTGRCSTQVVGLKTGMCNTHVVII